MRTYQREQLGVEDYTIEDRGYKTPCWIWIGQPNSAGYGKVRIAGKVLFAHRAMYQQEVGPISSHHDLDHLCRVTLCVNHEHVEPVPHVVNMRRGRGTRLTQAQVDDIRSDSRTNVAIAEEFGVSDSHVSRIKSGQKWAPFALSGAVGIIAKNLDS